MTKKALYWNDHILLTPLRLRKAGNKQKIGGSYKEEPEEAPETTRLTADVKHEMKNVLQVWANGGMARWRCSRILNYRF